MKNIGNIGSAWNYNGQCLLCLCSEFVASLCIAVKVL